MNVEDIESYQTEEGVNMDSYCASIFHLAYTQTMGRILGGHNNVTAFGAIYTVVPTDGKNLCTPQCFMEADDGSMRVILRDYATGDKCRATVTDGEKVYIRVVYQFTNQITQETEIRDICEELYGLILALSYYDKIKELKDMQGSGSYMLTEQDLKDIIPGDESAEVIELR